ncbi:phage tail assembly protein [Devosia sp.]|uniref:phage tail assembly protein n=1 Tax=Devosia sp. TaxID=1871048 RepID=UPI002735B5CE|nr:phage tail assembly protein [Devosia sp.]MDP2779840.1 phage tail assembly protein [Devosia sp.]
MPNHPHTITLTKPILHNGQSYSELAFSREMQMRDMFAMDEHEGQTRRTAALYASMADVPFEVIAQLNTAEMALAAQAVAAVSGKLSGAAPISPPAASGAAGATS